MAKNKVLVVFLFLLVVLSACSGAEGKIAGKWSDSTGYGTYEFKSDGTMVIGIPDGKIKGNYEIDGDKLILEAKGKQKVATFSFKKDKLFLTFGKQDKLDLVKVNNDEK